MKAREIDARVAGYKEALAAGRETARFAQAADVGAHLELYVAASVAALARWYAGMM